MFAEHTRSLYSLPFPVKINNPRMEYIVKAHMYARENSAQRITHIVYPLFHRSNGSKYTSRLHRWKSKDNYCSGDYFASLMRHIANRIKLHLPRVWIWIYHVIDMLIKTQRRGVAHAVLLSYYSGIWCSRGLVQVRAVECKCIAKVHVAEGGQIYAQG